MLSQVRDLLAPEAITVTGKPLVDYLDDQPIWDDDVIRSRDNALLQNAGIAVLRGNLAPLGAIVKPAAASPELLVHRGPAVVFDSVEDLHRRIDDPALDVDENSVLVLRGCGPKGYPGMPEVANLPLPRKLLEKGVRDMVRVCDAYERDGLRHRRVARRTRGSSRRAPRAHTGRRHDRARRAGAAPCTSTSRMKSSNAGNHQRRWSRDSRGRAVAGNSSTWLTSSKPIPASTSTSSSDTADRRWHGESH